MWLPNSSCRYHNSQVKLHMLCIMLFTKLWNTGEQKASKFCWARHTVATVAIISTQWLLIILFASLYTIQYKQKIWQKIFGDPYLMNLNLILAETRYRNKINNGTRLAVLTMTSYEYHSCIRGYHTSYHENKSIWNAFEGTMTAYRNTHVRV